MQWQETLKRELYGVRGGHDLALQKAIGDMPDEAVSEASDWFVKDTLKEKADEVD